jgi:hypothetical protein
LEQKEIALEDPLKTCGCVLVPVVRIMRRKTGGQKNATCFINKEPAAVVILKSDTYRIYNDRWEEISLEDFNRSFPGMSDKISNIL